MIAQRVLHVVEDGKSHDVAIRLFLPEEDDDAWRCAYEIDWPEGTRAFRAFGQDAVQAIQLAMQMIGTELYTSDRHRAGMLVSEVQGGGYGLPVPRSLRDLLVGDDITFFG